MRLTVQHSDWDKVRSDYKRLDVIHTSCCEQMRAAFDGGFIGYNDHGECDTEENNNVNIYKYDSDEESWSALPISYCPFCSAPIEIQHEHY